MLEAVRESGTVEEPLRTTLDEDSGTAAGTARDRLVIGVVSLALLLVGLLATAVGLGGLRTFALYLFCTAGLGAAPWQLEARLRLASRLLLSAATSLTVLVLVSAAMELAGSWHPWVAFALVAVVSVALHVLGLRRALADRRQSLRSDFAQDPTRRRGSDRVPTAPRERLAASSQVLVALLGFLLCLVAALTHRHLQPDFGGFPTQIGPLWWAGLVLLLGAVVLLGRDDRQLAVSVLLLVAVLTLTPALVYDGPRSQSAAKHVDLVQQIRTLGRAESRLGIYNSWAGFFSAAAWLCDVTGIRDPMVLARFWPALLAPVRVLALRQLFVRLLGGGRVVWVAVLLAVLADPLGADYFSPQSLGFVLGLTVYGLVLTRGRTLQRLVLVLALGGALAVSHQLSPYVVGGVLVVLVVLRQVRPWWTPALVLVPAVGWALVNFGDVSGFIDLSRFGSVANFRPPQTDASPGLDRLPIVGWTVRALAGGLLVLGLLAAWTWFRALLRSRDAAAGRRTVVLRLLAYAGASVVGLALVAANPYGQEGIFRAVLFAVPWLAPLAAQAIHRVDLRLGGLRGRLPLAAVAAAMTATFLVASFGLDRINVIRQGDVAVLDYLNGQASSGPDGSQLVLVLLAGDLPTSAGREGVTQRLVSYDDLDLPSGLTSRPVATQEEELTQGARDQARINQDAQVYVLWSPTSAAYSRAYGLQSFEDSDALRDAFAGDPRWEQVADDQGTVLFRFRG